MAESTIPAEDLDIIPPALADESKSEAEIWAEFDAADKAEEQVKDAPQDAIEASPASGEPEQPEAAPAPAAVDIWANATPEQKAAYDAAVAEKERVNHQARSDAARVAAHQRKIEELQRRLQPRNDSRDADRIKNAQEAVAAVNNDYPEIAGPMAKVLEAVDGTVKTISAAEQSRIEAAQIELAEIIKDETAKLEALHPDWTDVLSKHGGAQFAAWVEDQPRRVRETFVRNAEAIVDADSVAEFMSQYKAYLGITPAAQPASTPASPNAPIPLSDKRKSQLAATAAPQRTTGRPTVNGIPEDASPEAMWAYWDQQERAQGLA